MKVRNITASEQVIPNVGIVAPGEVIEVPDGFHNANFQPEKVVAKKEDKPKQNET